MAFFVVWFCFLVFLSFSSYYGLIVDTENRYNLSHAQAKEIVDNVLQNASLTKTAAAVGLLWMLSYVSAKFSLYGFRWRRDGS